MEQSPLSNLKHPILLDGAMGTQLQSLGLPPSTLSATWNLQKPDAVFKVHQDYLSAGSDIIFTNTFGVSPLTLDFWEKTNRAGVSLAKQAVDHFDWNIGSGRKRSAAKIAGSIGPLTSSKLSDQEIKLYHSQQIKILLEQGVDMLVLETMISQRETLLASAAALQLSGNIPLMVLMHVNEKAQLPDGSEPSFVAQQLEDLGVPIVGINCSMSFDAIERALLVIQSQVSCSLAVKPAKPDHNFIFFLEKMRSLGVTYLGGCCGTTPEDIKFFATN